MKAIVWFVFLLGAFSAAAKVIVTKPGQTADLECGVTAFSSILKWNHGNDLIFRVIGRTGFTAKGNSKTARRSKIKQATNLEISKVTVEDAGNFICEADGTLHEHTLLVFSASATPSAKLQLGSEVTLKCQVKGLKSEPELQWKRPGGGPASGSGTFTLKSVARSDAGDWSCLFSQDGMSYTESIEIRVHEPPTETPAPAVPTQGSKNVPKQPCKNCSDPRTPDAPGPELLGLIWWIWVAIGVGCLVVVLLIVLVIVSCKRNKRKKRKLEMMQNGRKPRQPKKYCECDRPAAAAKPQQGRRREKPSALPLQPLLME